MAAIGRLEPQGVVECSICLDEIVEASEFNVTLSCGHIFHQSCIDRYFQENRSELPNTCPLDRRIADIEGVYRKFVDQVCNAESEGRILDGYHSPGPLLRVDQLDLAVQRFIAKMRDESLFRRLYFGEWGSVCYEEACQPWLRSSQTTSEILVNYSNVGKITWYQRSDPRQQEGGRRMKCSWGVNRERMMQVNLHDLIRLRSNKDADLYRLLQKVLLTSPSLHYQGPLEISHINKSLVSTHHTSLRWTGDRRHVHCTKDRTFFCGVYRSYQSSRRLDGGDILIYDIDHHEFVRREWPEERVIYIKEKV